MRTYAMSKVARGVPDPRQPSRLQIVVAFDPDTFAEIRERAIRGQTSFAEQVRMLVDWGLETERLVK